MANEIPPPPPGFTLDAGVPPPPAGFTLDAPQTPEETYSQKVGRTGDQFEKVAGTGLRGVARTAVAAGENALSLFSGIAGDIAGAATSVATQDPKKGERVRRAITTEPATETGKAAQPYLSALTEPVAKALGYVPRKLDESGHPIAGQVARAAIDVAGGKKIFGARVPKAVTEATSDIAQDAAKTARAHGYVLKPSEAGGKAGTVAEGMTGSPRLSIEASLRNQKVSNKLAAEEIGLPKNAKLTPVSLKKAKKPHNKVYKEMSELGDITTDDAYKKEIGSIGRVPGKSFKKDVNPDIEKLRDAYAESSFNAADAVLKIRELRAKAVKNIKAREAPERNELGYAQRNIADAIENQMERHATSVGKSDLVTRFKAARQSLAKIHSVESSIVGNTGDVSAQGLAKQLNRGAPLSGKLKVIADTANEFHEVTRDATKIKNKVPVTVLEGASGAFGGAMAAASHPIIGGGALAGMVARPLTRKFLLSEYYQNKLAPGPSKKGAASIDLEALLSEYNRTKSTSKQKGSSSRNSNSRDVESSD